MQGCPTHFFALPLVIPVDKHLTRTAYFSTVVPTIIIASVSLVAFTFTNLLHTLSLFILHDVVAALRITALLDSTHPLIDRPPTEA